MTAASPGNGASLADVLADLGRALPGARLAVLLDTEGLVVAARAFGPAPEPGVLAAEVAGCFAGMGRVAVAARLGPGLEWSITGAGGVLVCRRVPGRELFLGVLADPGTWQGRVRFAARVAAGRLAEALGPPGHSRSW